MGGQHLAEKFAAKDGGQQRAEGGAETEHHRHAERHAQIAHGQPEGQAAQAPEAAEEISPAQGGAGSLVKNGAEIVRHQDGEKQGRDDPAEDSADQPVGFPRPFVDAAIGDVKTGRGQSADPMENEAEKGIAGHEERWGRGRRQVSDAWPKRRTRIVSRSPSRRSRRARFRGDRTHSKPRRTEATSLPPAGPGGRRNRRRVQTGEAAPPGSSKARSSAFRVARAPITQAAIRLMLASKKSMPMCTRSKVVAAHDLLHQVPRRSSRVTTWSLSQRMARLTCRRISGTNVRSEEILSANVSVG